MVYNLTSFDNALTPTDLFASANSIANGWMIPVILMLILFVIMVSMRKTDFVITLMIGTFICTILNILLWGAGFASSGGIGMFFVLFIASVVFYLATEG